MLESFIKLTEEYNDVSTAINEKKKELKEVHDIAVEADTFVALVGAKEKIKADKEDEALKIIEDANDKAKEVIDNAHTKEENIANQIQESIDNYTIDSKRKKDEFEYDFNREKKQKADALADKLAIDAKQLDIRTELIKAREDKAKEIDLIIENLNDEIDKIKVERDSEIKKQVAIAEHRAKRDKEFEVNTSKTKHEAEVSIKDNENGMLKSQIVDLKAQVTTLQRAVDNASERVTSIATASLESKANEGTIQTVMEAVKSGNQTNNKR